MFLVATGLVCGLAAAGLVLFTRAHVQLLETAFQERSTAYVQAFAASAALWTNDPESLWAAARLLTGGSAGFVLVVADGRLLVDARAPVAGGVELPPYDASAAISVLRRSFPAGQQYLDIRADLPGTADPATNYVRVGIDLASVQAQERTTIWLVIVSGLAFCLAVAGVLAWVLLRSVRTTEQFRPRPLGSVATAGPLRIDDVEKRVFVCGKEVAFTPKQFALLRVLAGQPGKVFAETEILAEVWPDSSYADAKDVKQYVYLIRKRIETASPGTRGLIETVPGYGYRFNPQGNDATLTEP
jgi:DNA-binding winged helix-turn-helix (wHTH) protein